MAKILERHRKAAKDAVYDYMVENGISYDWNQKHARDCYAQGMAALRSGIGEVHLASRAQG